MRRTRRRPRDGAPLRRGDVVTLRSPREILETLDETCARRSSLFMPEMLAYFGRAYTVSARVERACDAVSHARRMPDSVLLDDLRCNGGGHGGCQAGCRIYWKEAWLQRAPSAETPVAFSPDGAYERLNALAAQHSRGGTDGARTSYRCQVTEFLRSTELIRYRDVRSLVREVTSKNVSVWTFLRVVAGIIVNEPRRRYKGHFAFAHTGAAPSRDRSLGLGGRIASTGPARRRDRCHARPGRKAPGIVVRPRNAALLRHAGDGEGEGRTVHRRDDRGDGRSRVTATSSTVSYARGRSATAGGSAVGRSIRGGVRRGSSRTPTRRHEATFWSRLTGRRLWADAPTYLRARSTKRTSMRQATHKAFDAVLTDEERASPLDEQIAAAVPLDLAIEKELSRTLGRWVFDSLVAIGIDVKGKRILDLGAGLGAVRWKPLNATRFQQPWSRVQVGEGSLKKGYVSRAADG